MGEQDTVRQSPCGRYQLGAQVARGATGLVYRGVDLCDGSAVAVKLLRPDAAQQPDLVEGFDAEGAVLSRLDHPNVIRLRARTTVGSRSALVLDFIDGEDLRQRIRRAGPLPPSVAAGIAGQVAGALAYLHDNEIAHADVKPANLLVPALGGPVQLIDFGAARLVGVDMPGRPTLATPEYTAPEVATGEPPTPASDIYASGIVLFELLCGRSPFRGGSADEVLARHGRCVAVPPPGLPHPVWPIIEQCLAADPAARPQAGVLAARLRGLEAALDGLPASPPLAPDAVTWWPRSGTTRSVAPVGARPAPPADGPGRQPPPPPRPASRRLLGVGGVAGGGLALLAVVTGLALAAGPTGDPPVGGVDGSVGGVHGRPVSPATAIPDGEVTPRRAGGGLAESPAAPGAGAAGRPATGHSEPSGPGGSSGSAGSGVSVEPSWPADPGAGVALPADPGAEVGAAIGDPLPLWPTVGPAGSDTPN
ncbi:serine/threonine-protein kinase [Solwaraspora sp. WMMB335]|uniref:serine/threonine-protein kinase n=1 Tax=Solwaraspora sp. WMMB335 TaxID=3404118 RepID=UPI003B94F0F4